MAEISSREIRLKNRPIGMPKENDFELIEVPVPEPEDGQLLVRNVYMSVDPYMRGRMVDRKSYVPSFGLGEALDGGAVGQVVRSNSDQFQIGDYVSSMMGWREYFVSDGNGLMKIDPGIAPIQTYLGVLGMTGTAAYFGLLEIGHPVDGETVFVSAASGAVGAVVCQIAKIKGCRVVGSAGSDEKAAWLKNEVGIDAAFNYKNVDNLFAEVGKHCSAGIDVYFESVGGVHLEAAIEHMNDFGRIVLCGMISQYNATKRPRGPSNLGLAISRRLTIRGFIASDHYARLPQFHEEMSEWVSKGRIKWRETIMEGIENAPDAFIGLFNGENFGKMLVKIGPDPAV
jgi:NADPH-dependent curcumin reductase CurA